jgi:hypothetical protein
MKSGASVLYTKLPEKYELRENRHRDSDALLVGVNGFLHVISPILFAVVGETRNRIFRSNNVLSLYNFREIRFMEWHTLLTGVKETLPDCLYFSVRFGKKNSGTVRLSLIWLTIFSF